MRFMLSAQRGLSCMVGLYGGVELHGGGCTEGVVQRGLHGVGMQKVDWLMWTQISRLRHILR